MDSTSTKSNSSTSDVTHTLSLSAKIKRLQIEEKFKAFTGKTKKTFREIKLLFQDIKTSTSSKEMLKLLDIEDVKKSTIELENRIKAFKSYLQSELARLKSAEQQLNQTINESPIATTKLKRQPRIQTAKYNEIVPSPVKTMMTSPFKCLEVQQFQEFLMNSSNRYGGWNEYHHNIFVNHWHKYFGIQNENVFDGIDNHVEKNPIFSTFLDELLPKLQDIREEDIISHVKWYSKYIYHKERQQKAIDKWRSNRNVMKSAKVDLRLKEDLNLRNKTNRRKSACDYKINADSTDNPENIKHLVALSLYQGEARSFIRKCNSEDHQQENYTNENVYGNVINEENKKTSDKSGDNGNQALLHFQKSTKQWNNRVNSKNLKVDTNVNHLENIMKLRTPTWRVGL